MIDDDLHFAYYEHFLPAANYQIKFTDEDKGRAVWINSYIFAHADTEYLKECLAGLTPEFRAFILKAAEMICEAGSNADAETS
jgi:hypothetical protein